MCPEKWCWLCSRAKHVSDMCPNVSVSDMIDTNMHAHNGVSCYLAFRILQFHSRRVVSHIGLFALIIFIWNYVLAGLHCFFVLFGSLLGLENHFMVVHKCLSNFKFSLHCDFSLYLFFSFCLENATYLPKSIYKERIKMWRVYTVELVSSSIRLLMQK